MKTAALLALMLVSVPLFAKDHSSQYQVGIFSSTAQLSDGSIATCSNGICKSYNEKYNVHYVRTKDGLYSIKAPVSGGETLVAALLTNGASGEVHKEWFMDQLQEGDKVLFASSCTGRRNDCDFWLPDPNHPGKEFHTEGHFWPNKQLTNTQTLCGKGKLKPEVEAQVCPAAPAAPASPAPASAPTPPKPQ